METLLDAVSKLIAQCLERLEGAASMELPRTPLAMGEFVQSWVQGSVSGFTRVQHPAILVRHQLLHELLHQMLRGETEVLSSLQVQALYWSHPLQTAGGSHPGAYWGSGPRTQPVPVSLLLFPCDLHLVSRSSGCRNCPAGAVLLCGRLLAPGLLQLRLIYAVLQCLTRSWLQGAKAMSPQDLDNRIAKDIAGDVCLADLLELGRLDGQLQDLIVWLEGGSEAASLGSPKNSGSAAS